MKGSRDWKSAIEVARGLETVAAGSFSQRIAHYGCELALEADTRGHPEDALTALDKARQAAPQAPRPLVLAGQRCARLGQHDQALNWWLPLASVQPGALSVIATELATSALACGRGDEARAVLLDLHRQAPTSDLLAALLKLDGDATSRRQLLLGHLQVQPGLGPALSLLREHGRSPLDGDELQAVQLSVAQALRPLQRYRCAACGFEAQQYFWQCPGCHGWDTFPPRRLEDN